MERVIGSLLFVVAGLMLAGGWTQAKLDIEQAKTARLTEALREERIANAVGYWIRCDMAPPPVLVAECYCPVSTCR